MKEKLYSSIFYTLSIRTFASFFEQIYSMITEFAKRFAITALIILGGVSFVAAQTEGHGEVDSHSHSNHDTHDTQDAGHNSLDDGEHMKWTIALHLARIKAHTFENNDHKDQACAWNGCSSNRCQSSSQNND